ncbi:MAG: ATP-binding protein [Clostridia bacterium]|nr:ATP-binding protein [Clostridia bacterium]
MKELSLNILDITENSVKAGADLIFITLTETEETLTVSIQDNGCGMSPEFLEQVKDPFCTSRTTRKVGLGIPLLTLAARQTGGDVDIVSQTVEADPVNHGTETKAMFYKNHIDFTPIGDITETVCTLIQCNPHIDFEYRHTTLLGEVTLSTKQMREVLGEVPLNTYEVISWIREDLTEQYQSV